MSNEKDQITPIFKHEREVLNQSIYGRLSEDGARFAHEESQKKEIQLFEFAKKKIEQSHEDNKPFPTSELIEKAYSMAGNQEELCILLFSAGRIRQQVMYIEAAQGMGGQMMGAIISM